VDRVKTYAQVMILIHTFVHSMSDSVPTCDGESLAKVTKILDFQP